MEPFLNGNDHSNLREALQETGVLSGRPIIIHRFIGETGGTLNGVQPTRLDRDIPTTARIFNVSDKEMIQSGGFLTLGDLKTHTIVEIVGFENKSSNLKTGDKMTTDGTDYIVFGKPTKKFGAGGRLYTQTYWKKI